MSALAWREPPLRSRRVCRLYRPCHADNVVADWPDLLINVDAKKIPSCLRLAYYKCSADAR